MPNKQTEFISEIMENDFGTRVLITNPLSEQYLKKKKTSPNSVRDNLYEVSDEPFCGGAGGHDVWVERFQD